MAAIVDALSAHTLVGLDTSPFIYQIEGAPRYASIAQSVFDAIESGVFEAITSVLTAMELAVAPLRAGQPQLADRYEVNLRSYPHLFIVPIDGITARLAASIRAVYRLRAIDSLQLAACLQAGATAFLTNDRDLRRVGELRVLLLDDFLDEL